MAPCAWLTAGVRKSNVTETAPLVLALNATTEEGVIKEIFVFKIIATGATFGSGAVGGVFTPTLYTGAALGYLFGVAAAAMLPGWGLEPGAFGLVGMGAFLAAATGAPVMAIVMLFELTLNYQILMPVLLASVTGYYVCRSLTNRSLYKDALARKGAVAVAQHLATLKIGDLMQEDSGTVSSVAPFGDIVRRFLHSRHDFLHVVDNGRFLGAISLHDISIPRQATFNCGLRVAN